MTRIDVNVKENDLRFIRYEFWLKDTTLFLDSRIVLERKTKRHNLQVIFKESYSRIYKRDYGVKEEPDVDIDISLEAIRIARSMIKFERWER